MENSQPLKKFTEKELSEIFGNEISMQITPQQLMQLQNQLLAARAQEKSKISEVDKLKKDINKLQEEKISMEANQEELLNDVPLAFYGRPPPAPMNREKSTAPWHFDSQSSISFHQLRTNPPQNIFDQINQHLLGAHLALFFPFIVKLTISKNTTGPVDETL